MPLYSIVLPKFLGFFSLRVLESFLGSFSCGSNQKIHAGVAIRAERVNTDHSSIT